MDAEQESGQAGCFVQCVQLGGCVVLLCVAVLSSQDLAQTLQSNEWFHVQGNLQINKHHRGATHGQAGACIVEEERPGGEHSDMRTNDPPLTH